MDVYSVGWGGVGGGGDSVMDQVKPDSCRPQHLQSFVLWIDKAFVVIVSVLKVFILHTHTDTYMILHNRLLPRFFIQALYRQSTKLDTYSEHWQPLSLLGEHLSGLYNYE